MKRIILTDEEYDEIARFAHERGLNAKEAILAFVRFGNRAVENSRRQYGVENIGNSSDYRLDGESAAVS